MTKITFALGLLNHLRLQKTAPLARYCCLLSLAENRGRHMTATQIFRRFGLKEPLAGTLDSAVRQGLVEETQDQPKKLYTITPAGEALVKDLLNAASEIAH
jgi:DNA-binding PadR family transcriptional regulator